MSEKYKSAKFLAVLSAIMIIFEIPLLIVRIYNPYINMTAFMCAVIALMLLSMEIDDEKRILGVYKGEQRRKKVLSDSKGKNCR
jgi:hypothetical protein